MSEGCSFISVDHRVVEMPISLSLLSITFSITHDASCGWGLFLGSLFCSTSLLDHLSFSPKVLFYYILMYPGEEKGNPIQYSCLENPVDGGIWWATVHGVAKSQTRLSNWASRQAVAYLHNLQSQASHIVLLQGTLAILEMSASLYILQWHYWVPQLSTGDVVTYVFILHIILSRMDIYILFSNP